MQYKCNFPQPFSYFYGYIGQYIFVRRYTLRYLGKRDSDAFNAFLNGLEDR